MMVAILYEDEDLCSKALYRAGDSFDNAGKPDKAIDVFKELVERYPNNELAKKAEKKISGAQNEV